MNVAAFLKSFLIVGALTFVVSAIVSYLYALIAHGVGAVDWESAIRFAIILGVVIPSLRFTERKGTR